MAEAQSWRTDKRSSSARGYGHRWQKARAGHLRSHPLCVMCQARGQVVPATVVDHIKPHGGDQALFWDRSNWQSLCKLHHDSHKQAQDRTGTIRGCDQDGRPLDPGHHWHR